MATGVHELCLEFKKNENGSIELDYVVWFAAQNLRFKFQESIIKCIFYVLCVLLFLKCNSYEGNLRHYEENKLKNVFGWFRPLGHFLSRCEIKSKSN